MTRMKLILPYPPSTNRYWRNVNGKTIVSAEAAAYLKQAGWLAKEQGAQMLAGCLRVVYHFYRPRESGDLSNRIKILEDALNGIAWEDDKQVVEIHAYRHEDKRNPRVEIDIQEATV